MSSFLGYIETTENPGPENKRKKQIHFLICESCFWVASALNLYLIRKKIIANCPLCDGDRISAIPIRNKQNEYT
jgi:hypothetical protein